MIESKQPSPSDAEQLARLFHETYERLAPQFGYETRKETKQFDPSSPNGKLMVAVCGALKARLSVHEQPHTEHVIEMRLCEYQHLFLHPDILYRFTVDPDCKECNAALTNTVRPTADVQPKPHTEVEGETPRTDAAIQTASDINPFSSVVSVGFARELEMELNATQQRLGECTGGYETLQKELAALQSQNKPGEVLPPGWKLDVDFICETLWQRAVGVCIGSIDGNNPCGREFISKERFDTVIRPKIESLYENQFEAPASGVQVPARDAERTVERVWDGKKWVCPDCKREPQIRHIVTGHDHTDDTYYVCECEPQPEYKRVPTVPTQEMLDAAISIKKQIAQTGINHVGYVWAEEIYQAMIAAAPAEALNTPPQASSTQDDASELIERLIGLIESGRCEYEGCVDGHFPSARNGEPIPCMWHDERAVLLRLGKKYLRSLPAPTSQQEDAKEGKE